MILFLGSKRSNNLRRQRDMTESKKVTAATASEAPKVGRKKLSPFEKLKEAQKQKKIIDERIKALEATVNKQKNRLQLLLGEFVASTPDLLELVKSADGYNDFLKKKKALDLIEKPQEENA
jgi:hypothetical protein